MRTLAEERCSDPTNPNKDQKDGIARPALTTVVRIRAREVVWGNDKIVLLANLARSPFPPPMCQAPRASSVSPEELAWHRNALSMHAVEPRSVKVHPSLYSS